MIVRNLLCRYEISALSAQRPLLYPPLGTSNDVFCRADPNYVNEWYQGKPYSAAEGGRKGNAEDVPFIFHLERGKRKEQR